MAKPSVSVVVTNYNAWALASLCVQKCLELDKDNLKQVILYDDASTSPNLDKISEHVTLFYGQKNVGLPKALNTAVAKSDSELVVIFDADAYPVTPFCDELAEMFANNPRLGMVAFHTIGKSGQPTESYSEEPTAASIILGQKLNAYLDPLLRRFRRNTLSIFTCAMAVRRQSFDEIGGFDESFDWLDLDHDFSMRLSRSGWQLAIASHATAFHQGGGSPQKTAERVLRFYKVRWYLLKKFNKLRMPKLAKGLILLRLRVELSLLTLAGRLLYSDQPTLADKLAGRKKIIEYCRTHY